MFSLNQAHAFHWKKPLAQTLESFLCKTTTVCSYDICCVLFQSRTMQSLCWVIVPASCDREHGTHPAFFQAIEWTRWIVQTKKLSHRQAFQREKKISWGTNKFTNDCKKRVTLKLDSVLSKWLLIYQNKRAGLRGFIQVIKHKHKIYRSCRDFKLFSTILWSHIEMGNLYDLKTTGYKT